MSSIDDFVIEDGVLKKYKGRSPEVEIPRTVKSIGEGAFKDCVTMLKVHFPYGVTSISRGAFQGCRRLVSVELPSSLDTMGLNVFSGCISLKEINLPKYLRRIGVFAFSECISLTDIEIPERIYMLYQGTFLSCTSLRNVKLPANLVRIDRDVFTGCRSLSRIVVPNDAGIENSFDMSLRELFVEDIGSLSTEYFSRAAMTFILNTSEYSEEAIKKNTTYVKNNPHIFIELAMRDMNILKRLVDINCFSLLGLNMYLDEADRTHNTEAKAILLSAKIYKEIDKDMDLGEFDDDSNK